ncbi:retropepsin-like aspartic protease, partial [Planktothrix sp.]
MSPPSLRARRESSHDTKIDVNFNGQNTFEMLLDTGASGVVITPAMANALKVQTYRSLPINTVSD